MATVLLVTPDFDRGYRLPSELVRAGHIVFVEFDSRDALRLIDDKAVDVVVCDAVLPWMFGTDLIVAVRSAKQDPNFPAILLDGLPAGLEYELYDAQPLQVLARPWSATELSRMIDRLCGDRPGSTHGREPGSPAKLMPFVPRRGDRAA